MIAALRDNPDQPGGAASGMRSASRIHTTDSESLGARQSPRGDSEPPDPTLGEFGTQVRLN
ncbi:hypothetical protein D3C78_1953050 [compost metagenome]